MGKIYYFSPQDSRDKGRRACHCGNRKRCGIRKCCAAAKGSVSDEKVVQPLKEVIRIATPQDDEKKRKRTGKREKEAFQICLKEDQQSIIWK